MQINHLLIEIEFHYAKFQRRSIGNKSMPTIQRWTTYLSQGYPQWPWGLIAAGIAISGNVFYGKSLDITSTLATFIAIWFFFLLMHLISDLQSVDKDRLANPEKPLPQGLLSKIEVRLGIKFIQIGLIIYGLLIALGLHIITGILLILLAGFSWLISQKYIITNSMKRYPFVQILVHHLYAWPLAFLAISSQNPENSFNIGAWCFGTLLFCAFSLYELSHQLNPQAHPIQATALNFYGFKIVFVFACILLSIALICALFLGYGAILIPFDLALFVTFLLLFFNHRLFYATEFAAAVSLVVHSWVGAIL
jgi:hypothetical protein